MTNIYDNRRCSLGEGALWHPERQQLFWFDIIGKRLLSVQDGQQLEWQFDNNVSAAGWIDRDNLLIASDNAFLTLNLETGAVTHLLDLEADNATTRSNDGRADPWGGFWIGTMGRKAEPGAGTIYRLFQGEVRPLFRGITITNTICFAPDGSQAYFSDTARQQIMVQPLDEDGWPQGDARVFLDLSGSGRNPDGAVVDASGCLWVAIWGESEVIRIAPDGQIMQSVPLPAVQPTCPAFGGPNRDLLFVTSAAVDLHDPTDSDGRTFCLPAGVTGQAEHRVHAWA